MVPGTRPHALVSIRTRLPGPSPAFVEVRVGAGEKGEGGRGVSVGSWCFK